jgi:hypothetical protein
MTIYIYICVCVCKEAMRRQTPGYFAVGNMNPVNAHGDVDVNVIIVGRRETVLPRRRHIRKERGGSSVQLQAAARLVFRKEKTLLQGGGQRHPGLNPKGRTRDHKEMPSVRAKNHRTHVLVVQAQRSDSRQGPL